MGQQSDSLGTIPFIDTGGGVPLHVQLERQIRRLIALGAWGPGSAVPSVRRLASRLGINPNTTARVYRRLEGEGVLTTVPGGGTFVSETRPVDLKGESLRRLHPAVRHLVRDGIRLRLRKEEVLAALDWEWDQQEKSMGKEDDQHE
ncbi:MAG TPA: GntR family transcriptional regulator [Candidatus Angelobacter sp.]|nr:GntR family transcriptional regulator [Candidatus Angelobacter sp.]